MTNLYYPLRSLEKGHWFKLICGASFQHLPAVRNLTLAYTLAGADCIDVAADPAVIAAAQEGTDVARQLVADGNWQGGVCQNSPWVMVSLNDGEDPHFRKAEFNTVECPESCPRPCEKICPAQAIDFGLSQNSSSGVVSEICYGCGRCLPVCPNQLIYTRSYVSTPGAIAPLVLSTGVDAVEIHTQVGRLAEFERLWRAIAPWIDSLNGQPEEAPAAALSKLKLIAISCPDGDSLIDYLWKIYTMIAPLKIPVVWQTDGRPMSGDIGDGTTLAAVKLGQKVLAAGLPGYVQLAGGTNNYTVTKLRAVGMLKQSPPAPFSPYPHFVGAPSPPSEAGSPASYIAGIAYGSYARVLLSPILDQLEQMQTNKVSRISNVHLEDEPELLKQAVALARTLVSQMKSS